MANACVAEADLVLIAGSKMTAFDTARENPALLNPERQTFIQIDVEPRNLSWTFPVDHPLLGEAGVVMEQLLAAGDGLSRLEEGRREGPPYRVAHGFFGQPARQAGNAGDAAADHRGTSACPAVGWRSDYDAGENRIFW
ncbi:hypothetical protein IBL25_03840 [Roseomonas ludipueritiae]|uniref:Thiamine pyrophosphate enzyme central domain-containing protein n=1 Tax=Pseudoroseomonas ludipueritiae TaxID=198093 RepID=A0ABR7R2U1_9PROT|nr:hypothetical protein [Pseudoroseomonas ludipueritiae]